MMCCGQCGSLMSREMYGNWVACCDNIGYWWSSPPIQTDTWLGMPPSANGYWFYRTVNWPLNKLPTRPKAV